MITIHHTSPSTPASPIRAKRTTTKSTRTKRSRVRKRTPKQPTKPMPRKLTALEESNLLYEAIITVKKKETTLATQLECSTCAAILSTKQQPHSCPNERCTSHFCQPCWKKHRCYLTCRPQGVSTEANDVNAKESECSEAKVELEKCTIYFDPPRTVWRIRGFSHRNGSRT